MLLRKTTWFWKSGLAAISFVLILSISGCSDAPPEENTVSETVIDVQAIQEESEEDADEIISVCIDLYEKAEEENKLADLETIRSIVNRLGENGYSAVDSRNQINMTEPEKVVEFCEKVDAQEEAEITILEISYLREYCGYDEGSNSYEYEMIYASPYPPFGEVVDYTKNADGTITLIVDGVWPDYNSDLAFRNTVVVQPFEDGTFRYLSNSIEQIELELPPIARTKG